MELERDVTAAEWQTERVRELGAGRRSSGVHFMTRCVVAVDAWARSVGDLRVLAAVAVMLRQPLPKVTWLIGQKASVFFDKTYALNRVLAIILLRYVSSGRVSILQQKLSSVVTDPTGGLHVEIESGKAGATNRALTVDYAIIRHGVSVTAQGSRVWRTVQPDAPRVPSSISTASPAFQADRVARTGGTTSSNIMRSALFAL